jgi:hypothetical protein
MENKFLTFFKPCWAFIDNGKLFSKPFSWLYAFFAIANLFIPIGLLFQAIDKEILDAPGKFVLAFILIWFVIAFASWASFQLWWDRKSKITVTSMENDDFIATPIVSHLIQTVGEWLGIWIGIVGAGVCFIAAIFLSDESLYLAELTGLKFLSFGFSAIILFPVYGFLILVFMRFLAEQCRALASIANNTKRNR